MTTTFLRSDIDATGVALLGDLSLSQVIEVAREAHEEGSEECLRSRIEAGQRSTPFSVDLQPLIPRCLADPREREPFAAGAHEAGEVVARGALVPAAAEAISRLHAEVASRTTSAAMDLPQLDEQIARSEQEAKDEAQQAEIDLLRFESSGALRKARWPWRLLEVGSVGFETALMGASFAKVFGALDGPLAAVAADVWVQTGLFTAGSAATAIGLAYAGAWYLRRFPPGRSLVRLGAAPLLGAAALLGACVGVGRWFATRSLAQVTSAADDVWSVATTVLVALTSVAVAGFVLAARYRLAELSERLRAIEPREEMARRAAARLADERQKLVDRAARARVDAGGVEELESAFEAAVKLVARRLREREAAIEEQVEKCLGAWRHLMSRPKAVRDSVITYVIEIRRSTETDEEGKDRHNRPPPSAGAGGPSALVGVLLAAALAGPLMACSSPPPPTTWFIGCDGTGTSPEDVCSIDFLQRAFLQWATESGLVPGSSFLVVTSADSFGTTEVAAYISVPLDSRGFSRSERVAFLRFGLEAMAHVAIPSDQGTQDGHNRSDHLSLLLVIDREARNFAGHRLRAVLATDGWMISGPFNAERRVPGTEAVLDHLKAAGLFPDLSGFASVLMCGPHHHGARAAAVAGRDRLWKDLLASAGAPEAVLRTTCRGLYPAVPQSYLEPDPVAHAAATPTPTK